jgi:N utilization substance protein A
MQFDLKTLTTVLGELEAERGVTKEKVIEAIEFALATAYKKEYGKRDQVIRARFDINTGATEFEQIKTIVDETTVRFKEDDDDEVLAETDASQTKKILVATGDAPASADVVEDEIKLPLFNTEKHMLLDDARKIKKGAQIGDEIIFPLEMHDDFGRIAAQTAKQVIIQKIREAEKEHLSHEYGEREGEILSGTVQRVERGNVFVDLGRAVGILPYDEQIPGERFRAGERIRAYLFKVEETPRGVFLRMSRSHPQFLVRLFEAESPEVAQGVVEIKAIAREPGSRSKVAVFSNDEHIDPVGSLVGQRGVRVSTVMSELAGEKIDVIEWSETPEHFIEDALSPAKVLSVEIIDEETHSAVVRVTEDQQSLAIGRGGQNVRLAAKLTGWRIDIQSAGTEDGVVPEDDTSSEASMQASETPVTPDSVSEPETTKSENETSAPETESDTSEKGE